MPSNQFVALESACDGALARITIDNPKGNVLTAAVMKELRVVLAEAQSDTDVKMITIGAKGPHFSFG